jgi:hypothetical protein
MEQKYGETKIRNEKIQGRIPWSSDEKRQGSKVKGSRSRGKNKRSVTKAAVVVREGAP